MPRPKSPAPFVVRRVPSLPAWQSVVPPSSASSAKVGRGKSMPSAAGKNAKLKRLKSMPSGGKNGKGEWAGSAPLAAEEANSFNPFGELEMASSSPTPSPKGNDAVPCTIFNPFGEPSVTNSSPASSPEKYDTTPCTIFNPFGEPDATSSSPDLSTKKHDNIPCTPSRRPSSSSRKPEVILCTPSGRLSRRSESRGRSRIRDASTTADPEASENGSRELSAASWARQSASPEIDVPAARIETRSSSPPSHQDHSPPAARRGRSNRRKEHEYVTKGAFLVKKNPEMDRFRFPKPQSQPEPWRAGDGFSEDEGNPDFIFFVTGKHKRKRRGDNALAGVGSLSMETDSGLRAGIRAFWKRRRLDEYALPQRQKLGRCEQKDVWPTAEDFHNSTLPERPTPVTYYASDDDMPAARSPSKSAPEKPCKVPWQIQRHVPRHNRERKGALDFDYLNEEAEIEANLARVHIWRDAPSDEEPSDHGGSDLAMTDDGQIKADEGGESREESPSTSSSCASSSVSSSRSVHSYWDKNGNHVFAGDIRAARQEYAERRRLEYDYDEDEDGFGEEYDE